MIYVFDIDGTICETDNGDYQNSIPYKYRIAVINDLYEAGNEIILNTARGYVTEIDWRELTTRQLNKWGVKYTKLLFNKPYGDVYIDDKAIKDEDFF